MIQPAISQKTKDLIQRLNPFYSAIVSDNLDRLGINGLMRGVTLQSRLPEAGKIIAPALTIQFRKTLVKQEQWGLLEAIDTGRHHIIVVDTDYQNGGEGSVYGGLMSLGSKVNDVLGAVVDGTCRDIEEVEINGFPLYARGVCPLTAVGRLMITGLNVTIECAGVRVRPGDIIFADRDGVVCIPIEAAESVVELGERHFQNERNYKQEIMDGKPLMKVFSSLKDTDQA